MKGNTMVKRRWMQSILNAATETRSVLVILLSPSQSECRREDSRRKSQGAASIIV